MDNVETIAILVELLELKEREIERYRNAYRTSEQEKADLKAELAARDALTEKAITDPQTEVGELHECTQDHILESSGEQTEKPNIRGEQLHEAHDLHKNRAQEEKKLYDAAKEKRKQQLRLLQMSAAVPAPRRTEEQQDKAATEDMNMDEEDEKEEVREKMQQMDIDG